MISPSDAASCRDARSFLCDISSIYRVSNFSCYPTPASRFNCYPTAASSVVNYYCNCEIYSSRSYCASSETYFRLSCRARVSPVVRAIFATCAARSAYPARSPYSNDNLELYNSYTSASRLLFKYVVRCSIYFRTSCQRCRVASTSRWIAAICFTASSKISPAYRVSSDYPCNYRTRNAS